MRNHPKVGFSSGLRAHAHIQNARLLILMGLIYGEGNNDQHQQHSTGTSRKQHLPVQIAMEAGYGLKSHLHVKETDGQKLNGLRCSGTGILGGNEDSMKL